MLCVVIGLKRLLLVGNGLSMLSDSAERTVIVGVARGLMWSIRSGLR